MCVPVYGSRFPNILNMTNNKNAIIYMFIEATQVLKVYYVEQKFILRQFYPNPAIDFQFCYT